MVRSREHDSVSLQELHRPRHRWEVGPFVQLVGHDNCRKQSEQKSGNGRVRSGIEKDDHRNKYREANKNIVSIHRDEIAVGHLERINVMVAKRLHKLLPDHGCIRRTEIVEQKMNDPRKEICEGVTSYGSNQRHQRSRPERARRQTADGVSRSEKGENYERTY